MAATIARVLEMVRDRLDEPNPRQWTQRQLRGWILEGSIDLARKSLQLLDTVTISATGGVAEYTVAANVLEIHAAYWTRDGDIQLMVSRQPADFDLNGADDTDPLDIPTGWADLVAYYAESCALRKDRDARWQEAKALYDEGLQSLIDNGNALTQGGEVLYDNAGAFLPAWLVHDGGW